ncbi:MAG: SufE family protein [Candidatus Woesearchaeota archaeon]
MSRMKEKSAEYTELLTDCDNRWDMLQVLMELGEELEDYPPSQKNPANKAPNCISQVYLFVEITPQNTIKPHITADAHIVKGYAKILTDMFTDVKIEEFLQDSQDVIKTFIEQTKIDSSFLSSRANAFGNMFEFLTQKVKLLHEGN